MTVLELCLMNKQKKSFYLFDSDNKQLIFIIKMHKKTVQYKKICHSPAKSPSPDYNYKSRSPLTKAPLGEVKSVLNRSSNFQTCKSAFQMTKEIQQIQNTKPQSTGPKSKKRQLVGVPEISKFSVPGPDEQQSQQCEISVRVQSIYKTIFRANQPVGCSFLKDNKQTLKQLQCIRSFVQNKLSHQNIKNGSLAGSPIKKPPFVEEESSFSILGTNQPTFQNNRLKRDILLLKLELEANKRLNETVNRANEQTIVQQQEEQDSDFGVQIVQFLRQKVSYLQRELQDKLDTFLQIQVQKNRQIQQLQHRLQKQLEKKEQKIQLNQINFQTEKKRQKQLVPQNRNRRASTSQEPLVTDTGLKRNRSNNGLVWDKEQIKSIIENHRQQTVYSEVEDLNFIDYFNKKSAPLPIEVQSIKNYYQKCLQAHQNKYRSKLESLQAQLLSLIEYIKNYDSQGHGACMNCDQLTKKLNEYRIERIENEKKSALDTSKIQILNEQIQKLRDLCDRSFKDLSQSAASRSTKKRRGLESVNVSDKKHVNQLNQSFHQLDSRISEGVEADTVYKSCKLSARR